MKINLFARKKNLEAVHSGVAHPNVHSIDNYTAYIGNAFDLVWNGEKYTGHLGPVKNYSFIDYWELRKRSFQLFTENPYCKGIIRRILRNEIFTGIVADATPLANIIWPTDDENEREERAQMMGEQMTNAFNLYANNYEMFDYKRQLTFGEWQAQVRMESILCGDGIIISRINKETGLPSWDWINGNYIRGGDSTNLTEGHVIKHGVELDAQGRHVAYYVETYKNGIYKSERIPVKGKRSGRQIAWMVYGSEKLVDDVRGEPLLSGVLGILKELDRYRDAEERAAVVNAMLAFFVKKNTSTTIGSRPTAGFSSFGQSPKAPVEDNRQPINIMQPGTVIDDLAPGEEIQSFQTNRPNVNYATFEKAILDAVCWSLEIPPEVVTMKFQSSYSASRQANNEFEVYLKYRTFKNAKDFCQIVYEEFIIQAAINNQIELPGFLSVIISNEWQKRAAWLNCAWTGLSRPAVDREKDVSASGKALDLGLTTFDIESRRTCGLSFRQVMARRKREKQLMDSMGFVPHVDEDNNGQPVYQQNNSSTSDSVDGAMQSKE